jgi:hypothetical protein
MNIDIRDGTVDEVYRGYRIAIKQADRWTARVTHVRGPYVPLDAKATLAEGEEVCATRARELIDRYVAFLEQNGLGGEPNQHPPPQGPALQRSRLVFRLVEAGASASWSRSSASAARL